MNLTWRTGQETCHYRVSGLVQRPLCEVGNYVKLDDQPRHFEPWRSGHSAHSCRASKTSQSRQVVSSRRRSRRARRAARSAVPSWPSAAQRNDAGGSWFRDPCAAGSASSSISLRRSCWVAFMSVSSSTIRHFEKPKNYVEFPFLRMLLALPSNRLLVPGVLRLHIVADLT